MRKEVTLIMMTVTLSTFLPLPADLAWHAATQAATFNYVTRGVLVVRGPLPTHFTSGANITLHLRPLGVLPGWTHHLHVERVDDTARELRTCERGGPLQRWNHRLHVQPQSRTTCRYTDTVTIDAGLLTPFAWGIAHLFFLYRQARWRRLARHLARRSGSRARRED